MAGQSQQSSILGKIAAYTEILAKDPKSTIFVSLSEAYRKMGMLDDARQVAESGLEYHADFTPAHIVLARILCQQGDYPGSARHFERALALDEINLAALVGYARLNIITGTESRARELLLEARKHSPADPVINKLLLSLPEESPPAESIVSEPAAEAAAEAEAVVTEAETTKSQAEPDAEAEEEADSTSPALASATLADLYLKQGLEGQALEMYRQLSAQDPNNLALRRKIRDLEEMLTAPPAPGMDAALEIIEETPKTNKDTAQTTVDVETSVQNDAAEELVSAVAEDEFDAVATSNIAVDLAEEEPEVATLNHQVVLERLNRWLENIQQRRRDV